MLFPLSFWFSSMFPGHISSCLLFTEAQWYYLHWDVWKLIIFESWEYFLYFFESVGEGMVLLKNCKSNFVSMHLVHFCKMSVLDLYIHMSKTCNSFLFSGRHFILCLMWTIQLNIINVRKFNWIFSLNSTNVISSSVFMILT